MVADAAGASVSGVAVLAIHVESGAVDAFSLLRVGGVSFATRADIPSRALDAVIVKFAALEAGLILEEILPIDTFGAVVDPRARVAGRHQSRAILAVIPLNKKLRVAAQT